MSDVRVELRSVLFPNEMIEIMQLLFFKSALAQIQQLRGPFLSF
jgi:hypothetical protein